MVVNFLEILLEHNATEKRLLIVARPLWSIAGSDPEYIVIDVTSVTNMIISIVFS
jgi:hypothetical protein